MHIFPTRLFGFNTRCVSFNRLAYFYMLFLFSHKIVQTWSNENSLSLTIVVQNLLLKIVEMLYNWNSVFWPNVDEGNMFFITIILNISMVKNALYHFMNRNKNNSHLMMRDQATGLMASIILLRFVFQGPNTALENCIFTKSQVWFRYLPRVNFNLENSFIVMKSNEIIVANWIPKEIPVKQILHLDEWLQF